jgi:hypothetical protein
MPSMAKTSRPPRISLKYAMSAATSELGVYRKSSCSNISLPGVQNLGPWWNPAHALDRARVAYSDGGSEIFTLGRSSKPTSSRTVRTEWSGENRMSSPSPSSF